MSITIAQVTDTHLLDSPEDEMRGVKTWYSLQAVLEDVANVKPDHLLLTGDLAHHGTAKAYQNLLDLITPFNISATWLPGNHDCPETMKHHLTHSLFSPPHSLALGNWQILSLSTITVPEGYGEGRLPEESLAWLRSELETTHRPTVIALHQHPVRIGIDWLDQMGVVNDQALLAIIDPFPQVKVVLFGHIHHAFHHQRNGVDYYGCPSTCTQVVRDDTTDPTLHQPGFRLLHLNPNGDHETVIHRVANALSRG
ncbi:MAG: metallophosphoesterase [Halothece sp. Uz-M2-17]|nr:metallophosphoesterase [Halothece sp. Uz-M2-17]